MVKNLTSVLDATGRIFSLQYLMNLRWICFIHEFAGGCEIFGDKFMHCCWGASIVLSENRHLIGVGLIDTSATIMVLSFYCGSTSLLIMLLWCWHFLSCLVKLFLIVFHHIGCEIEQLWSHIEEA